MNAEQRKTSADLCTMAIRLCAVLHLSREVNPGVRDGGQSKSAVTDHAITLNHVIDRDQAKVVDRESNRMDRWIKEAIHIRKEQDEGSYQLSHIYDRLFAARSGGERKLSRPFRRRQQPLPKRQTINMKGCI